MRYLQTYKLFESKEGNKLTKKVNSLYNEISDITNDMEHVIIKMMKGYDIDTIVL